MTRQICPICETKKLVEATGSKDAKILIFGWAPGKKEIAKGIPWVGPAGQVLESELLRYGIQRHNYRLTNLWMHEVPSMGTKKNPNPLYQKELDWHFAQLVLELHNREAILIMGAEPTAMFGLPSISNISGTFVSSVFFPKSVKVAVAMVNPAQALHDLLGETRFGISNFAIALSRNHVKAI